MLLVSYYWLKHWGQQQQKSNIQCIKYIYLNMLLLFALFLTILLPTRGVLLTRSCSQSYQLPIPNLSHHKVKRVFFPIKCSPFASHMIMPNNYEVCSSGTIINDHGGMLLSQRLMRQRWCQATSQFCWNALLCFSASLTCDRCPLSVWGKRGQDNPPGLV